MSRLLLSVFNTPVLQRKVLMTPFSRNVPFCPKLLHMDGQVWKEFNSDKFSNFLKNKRCYGVMLNMDFLEPYKHIKESYGVLYLSLMNLPWSERFKQENIMLLGILPHFVHEPPSLNTFLGHLSMSLWNFGIKV